VERSFTTSICAAYSGQQKGSFYRFITFNWSQVIKRAGFTRSLPKQEEERLTLIMTDEQRKRSVAPLYKFGI
jgi:hypothetical protein